MRLIFDAALSVTTGRHDGGRRDIGAAAIPARHQRQKRSSLRAYDQRDMGADRLSHIGFCPSRCAILPVLYRCDNASLRRFGRDVWLHA